MITIVDNRKLKLYDLVRFMPFQKLLKPVVFLLCLVPLLLIIWRGFNNELGVNPAETILDTMAHWGLYFLLITLAVTPVRKLTGIGWVAGLRRMFGLFSFFYVCLHLVSYIWFDQYFDWHEIGNDIVKRPFIALGFAAFIMLIPLTVTSNRFMIIRLKKNWQRLHKLVYPIAILGVIHFFLMTRADFTHPLIMALVLTLLLGYRVVNSCRRV